MDGFYRVTVDGPRFCCGSKWPRYQNINQVEETQQVTRDPRQAGWCCVPWLGWYVGETCFGRRLSPGQQVVLVTDFTVVVGCSRQKAALL
jgi:hypothetical protein